MNAAPAEGRRTFLIFYEIWRPYWHVSCILPIIDSSLNPDSLATVSRPTLGRET